MEPEGSNRSPIEPESPGITNPFNKQIPRDPKKLPQIVKRVPAVTSVNVDMSLDESPQKYSSAKKIDEL